MHLLPETRHIRRRLFVLLMQAFGMVVGLTVISVLLLFSIVIGMAMRGTTPFTPQTVELAQVYYMGRGNWEGVEQILDSRSLFVRGPEAWEASLLVDAEHRILIDEGRVDTPRIGEIYAPAPGDVRFAIRIASADVGAMVMQNVALSPVRMAWSVLRGLFWPVLVISFFTGLLTLLMGFLLARRVVMPLADVIAAAHAVATGDLSARVPVRGPGDLRGLSDSFNRMAETLEHNDRERRGMLADIAHELRTPLTVMRGKLEGIVDGVYAADEANIAPVLTETYVLERLVEDLRLLTLAEMRQLHFDLQPTSLTEVVEHVADLFEAEAAERGLTLNVEAPAGLPQPNADAQRVEQIIANLVSNALRYTPETGLVTLSVRAVPGGVECAVSDTGPGVPEADLPKLFDRFWRGEKSRGRAAGGAGLGLAIAKQLVEAQGGTITAQNLLEGGLRVAFVLKA